MENDRSLHRDAGGTVAVAAEQAAVAALSAQASATFPALRPGVPKQLPVVETSPHAQRLGAAATELYPQLAPQLAMAERDVAKNAPAWVNDPEAGLKAIGNTKHISARALNRWDAMNEATNLVDQTGGSIYGKRNPALVPTTALDETRILRSVPVWMEKAPLSTAIQNYNGALADFVAASPKPSIMSQLRNDLTAVAAATTANLALDRMGVFSEPVSMRTNGLNVLASIPVIATQRFGIIGKAAALTVTNTALRAWDSLDAKQH